jgi:hypothetical protein
MSWSGRPALKGFFDGSRRVIESADLDGADRVEEGGQHRDRQSLWLALPVGPSLRGTAWASKADRRADCLTTPDSSHLSYRNWPLIDTGLCAES